MATAIAFALVGVLGSHNATVPQAAGTTPEDKQRTQTVTRTPKTGDTAKTEPDALRSPGADGPAMTTLWSGDYRLRMGVNLELDKGNQPVRSEGAANEVWVDNLGDAGYVVFTEGTLAPWDVVGRQPTPQQCHRTLQSGGTVQLDVTVGDAGRGICLRSTTGDRYAYMSLTTISRSDISGTLTLWTTKRP